MSLGVAALKPTQRGRETIEQKHDNFGLPNVLVDGLESKKKGQPVHPLEFSEQNWDGNKEDMYYSMLRRTQGMHAPLRLQMEKHTARQMRRLPCLHSSNLMENVLTSKIDSIGVEDVFNSPFDAEIIGQPHPMMERKLGLL